MPHTLSGRVPAFNAKCPGFYPGPSILFICKSSSAATAAFNICWV